MLFIQAQAPHGATFSFPPSFPCGSYSLQKLHFGVSWLTVNALALLASCDLRWFGRPQYVLLLPLYCQAHSFSTPAISQHGQQTPFNRPR